MHSIINFTSLTSRIIALSRHPNGVVETKQIFSDIAHKLSNDILFELFK